MEPTQSGEFSAGIFYAAAGVFLLWETWRGWRLGVIRAGLKLGALVGSGVVGWYGGVLAANIAASMTPLPPWLVGLAAGLALAVTVYVGFTLVSCLCFKRTGHQSVGIARFLFGLGGAAFGLLTGMIFLVAAVSGIRAFGGMAEGREQAGAHPDALSGLVGMKKSLDSTATGALLRKADPIPDSTYSDIQRFSRVLADPSAVQRLAESPEIMAVLMHPKIIELAEDPAVQQASRDNNVLALMANPKLLKTASDPELAKALLSINLGKALDDALAAGKTSGPQPAPDSTPSP